ncbi:MAG: GNAT family N-acetyltransferase [Bacilli bacterium]|nr:GNAT family N-acetyltransferase [Bacilli bacterium]
MIKEEKTNDFEKIRQLRAKRDNIIKQLEELEKKIESKFYDTKLSEQIMRKKRTLFELEKTIKIYSSNPDYTNGFIDLYNISESNSFYLVCFHEEKKPIGELGCSDSIFANNISYCIYKEYRNKGLGFQSVCLLLEYLNSKGIENITIFVEKNNIPSLRIAEKLKDIYKSYTLSNYDTTIAFHFCINNKKLESNTKSK